MTSGRKEAFHAAVPMEIWSANMSLKAKVDAAAWLRSVSSVELRGLIAARWMGSGSAAPAVRFYAERNWEVENLVGYVARAQTDLHFSIDEVAALAWLKESRPAVDAMLVACAAA